MSQETQDWLEKLSDDISEKIMSVTKFKTHKQRKAFLGDIANQIKTAVANNTIPKNVETAAVRKAESAITRPNPNGKGVGHAIMTEGMSSRGDDILGVGPSSQQPGKVTSLDNKGMRSW